MDGKTVRALGRSPINWNDSGKLRAVGRVPGGSVNPGKVVAGLARAAEAAGAQIAEHAELMGLEFGGRLKLQVERRRGGFEERKIVAAKKLLIATNAGSVDFAGALFAGKEPAEPKLTFALATERLSRKQLKAIGLGSRRPFYTVDLPYLWGKTTPDGRLILGSGLVPGWGESLRMESRDKKAAELDAKRMWQGLEHVDVRKGVAAERLKSLEKRVRALHPVLKKIRITHRWAGPILLTKGFMPVFRKHPRSDRVIVAGGYSGHGVALSVYLGKWAAGHLLGRRELPDWPRP